MKNVDRQLLTQLSSSDPLDIDDQTMIINSLKASNDTNFKQYLTLVNGLNFATIIILLITNLKTNKFRKLSMNLCMLNLVIIFDTFNGNYLLGFLNQKLGDHPPNNTRHKKLILLIIGSLGILQLFLNWLWVLNGIMFTSYWLVYNNFHQNLQNVNHLTNLTYKFKNV